MKPYHIIFSFVVCLCFGLLTGCASQSAGPAAPKLQPELQSAPRITQRPHDYLLASAADLDALYLTQIQDEDLFEEDASDPFFDDLDDLDGQDIYTVADPLEPFNRTMFYFNDKLYFWVLKPLASGYRAVTPQTVRVGIRNFFVNLLAPVRVVNNILQGKGQAAEAEFAKFVYNSTVGVLGFGNPSKSHPALNPDPEDLGQTLASYGIGDGFYIVWPVLGASTLRDTIGDFGDGFLNPVSYAYVDSFEEYLTIQGVDTINSISFTLGDYETFKKAALDPYEAMRNGYIQQRQSKIKK